MVTLAFCLPAQAEILVFKTTTTGQQLNLETNVVEKKKENGYLIINADLSNPNNITVGEAQFLHYETEAGKKVQNTAIPSNVQIFLVDNGKTKKMLLRCFDEVTGTYIVVNGTASLRNIGEIQRYISGSLSGSSVWRQVDYFTGSGSITLALDLKATQLANTQSSSVTQIIENYSILEQTKGYTTE
jgi:hypothetical protein